MSYGIFLSYDAEFVSLMDRLKSEYPAQLFDIHGISNSNLDINEFSRKFYSNATPNVASVSVDANANVGEKTLTQYTYELPKSLMKLNSLFLIWKWVRDTSSRSEADQCIEAMLTGAIFVNDLHGINYPYCYALDLSSLCNEGFSFFRNVMRIGPPNRSDSFIDLLIQLTAYASNQIMGAISYPSLFVNFDWYLRKDYGDDYVKRLKDRSDPISKTIHNLFQKFIYSVNFPFRGSQSPFTNVSVLDRGFLDSLFGLNENGVSKYPNPDGTAPDLNSVYELQKHFYCYFDEIFGKENVFTFPVITLAVSLDSENSYIDPEFVKWIAETYAPQCLGNIYIGKPTSFSSCCRLKNDYEKLTEHKEYQNSFGVGGLSIGSHRVSGLSLPHLAYEMRRDKTLDFKPYIKKYQSLCHRILFAHRELLKDSIRRGMLPLFTTGIMSLDKMFSTYGFVGAYEFLEILRKDIRTEDGKQYLLEVLKEIERRADDWSRKDKAASNTEQIPAESKAVELAKIDRILGYNDSYDLYSNQYVPLISDQATIYERFIIQGNFDSTTSGGAILHVNIDEGCDISPLVMERLLETARETRTAYFALNRIFAQCENEHVSISNSCNCPECGGKIDSTYTRVVGFLRPTKSWSPQRQDEFRHRFFYAGSEC